MNAIKLIGRAEMKNVMGGQMDRETTLQYCLNKVDNYATLPDAEDDYIMRDVAAGVCYEAYDRMPS